jgi:hypothetical protein
MLVHVVNRKLKFLPEYFVLFVWARCGRKIVNALGKTSGNKQKDAQKLFQGDLLSAGL